MVSVEEAELQERFYINHVEDWIKTHPGEYILIEGTRENEQKFFKTEQQLEAALRKYKGVLGPTITTEKIPSEMTPELRSRIGLHNLLRDTGAS